MLSPFVHQVPSISSPFLNRRRGSVVVGSTSPLALFFGGAIGVWFDPSDTTTMFEDTVGSIPVTTPGQPVGLRLDKSKGLVLGPELVNNGGPFVNTTGWLPYQTGSNISVSGSRLVAVDDCYFPITGLTVGRTYQVNYSLVSGSLNLYVNADATGNAYILNKTGTGTVRVTVINPVLGIYLNANTTVASISVKELAGNHASQSTLAARPTYGIEPRGGRRNLLLWSEDFGNAVWFKTGANASGQEVRETTANSGHLIFQNASYTGSHAFSLELQAVGRDLLTIWMGTSSGTFAFQYTFSTDTISSVGSALSGVTSSVLTGGWVKFTGVVLTPNRFQVSTGAPGAVYVGDPATGFNIRNAQLEIGSIATNYQKVTTEFDVTEAGVPTCHYVAYGGSHSMATAAIDFTATDKMSVFAGVRKSGSDGMMLELSSSAFSNAGSFAMFPGAYGVGGSDYAFASGGSIRTPVDYEAGVSVPYYGLMTGLGDISGDLNRLRVNGTQVGQSVSNQGTGNFGNYPLYFGRRNNADFPFNGRDYGIIVVGKTASPTEITTTETWLAEKTGFFAPVITGVPTIGVS